ncbi:MAG: lipopolysaccharide biosynthesis protein [Acidobacteriaceae bacterium]|nr:lipopolysaccharide biosynthesis protein [Acidobacteriaceae bacterium]
MLITPEATAAHERIVASSEPYVAVHEISLHEIVRTITGKKRLLIRNCLVAAALGTGLALLIPPTYTAEAVILTPQQSQSTLASLAQMSGLGAGSGLAALGLLSDFGIHNSTTLYIGILESRTVADAVISHLDLRRFYKKKDLYSTRKQLINSTQMKAGKDTLIHIKVEDGNPAMAARIAQSYVDELFRLNASVALTEASQRRLFFEQQLAKEKDLLAAAETAMKDSQQSTGLVAPTGQAEALIRSLSVLQSEILNKEAQVDAMKTYIADENPRLRTAERELSVLRGDLAKLERGQHTPGSPEVPAGQLPEAGLEFVRKYRDVKYHETLFELLAKQYEAARLDEAKSGSIIQVIDRPVPPERKSWPPRKLIVLGSCMLSGFGTSLWIVLKSGSTGS